MEENIITRFCVVSADIIASGSYNGTVTIWNLKTKEHIYSFSIQREKERDNNINSILRLPDGNIVIGSWEPVVYIYNPLTGQVVHSFRQETDTVNILLLPDNRFINIMSNCTFRLWE